MTLASEEHCVGGEVTLEIWAASYRPVAIFHSPLHYCATWAQEQIHSTGHESRLKRDLGGAFGKPRYARRAA